MKTMKRRFAESIPTFSVLVCLATAGWAQSQEVELADKRYNDPKGYFTVVPPAGWRIQEYPDEVRGKVAFLAPDRNVDLRVLVNAVDFSTIDELLEFCRSAERRLGVTMKIERFDFYGRQAVRRSFEIRGQRFLYVDFLIGEVDHNLAYGAPPSKYDLYLPLVLKSMETYEPILKEVGDQESVAHLVAKKLRLGQLMLESGRADLAIEYVREGLALAPENQELLNLQQELNAQSRKGDEQDARAPAENSETARVHEDGSAEATNPLFFMGLSVVGALMLMNVKSLAQGTAAPGIASITVPVLGFVALIGGLVLLQEQRHYVLLLMTVFLLVLLFTSRLTIPLLIKKLRR